MTAFAADEPLAAAVVQAIREGDLGGLKSLLAEHPDLAASTIAGVGGRRGAVSERRSLLHVATDWPGHFPGGPATVAALIEAGADVNARFIGPHTETPLHWAASCDDVGVLDALLDAGAEIEATGAVIGGGTALADAVAFGQWSAARRLVERGARTTLWQAAALGLMDRIEAAFADPAPPAPDDVTNAFWCACHGGQLRSAQHLLGRGADLNRVGYDQLTPLGAASRSGAEPLVRWLQAQGAR